MAHLTYQKISPNHDGDDHDDDDKNEMMMMMMNIFAFPTHPCLLLLILLLYSSDLWCLQRDVMKNQDCVKLIFYFSVELDKDSPTICFKKFRIYETKIKEKFYQK